jgi:hypothetical protein
MTVPMPLILTALLAVPTPKDAPQSEPVPEPKGVAPTILFLKPEADGVIRLTVRRTIDEKGRPRDMSVRVPLREVKELTITTPNGLKVDLAEAERRLGQGGCVLIPGTNPTTMSARAAAAAGPPPPISPAYLRMFRNDVLILSSFELRTAVGFGPTVRNPSAGKPAPALPAN